MEDDNDSDENVRGSLVLILGPGPSVLCLAASSQNANNFCGVLGESLVQALGRSRKENGCQWRSFQTYSGELLTRYTRYFIQLMG